MTRPRCINGFTLPEVLIAAGITAIVFGAVYAAFWPGIRAGNRASAELHLAARETLDLIGRDIRSACFRPESEDFILSGQDGGRAGNDSDELAFCSVIASESEEPQPSRVRYHLDKHPVTGATILYRERTRMAASADGAATVSEPVAPFVQTLDIKYFESNSWKEFWDNREKLPEIILVTVGVGHDGEAETFFDSEISLPLAGKGL